VTVQIHILPPRYRGPERIGHGGMGDIYSATDSVLGRAPDPDTVAKAKSLASAT